MEEHNPRVAQIAARVKSFHKKQVQFRIYHGTTSTTRRTQLSRDTVVDTSQLNHVLKIDTDKKTALVEANVSMEQLVEATFEHDLLPPVVMEFPAITVGGGFAGTSGESSSFKHGLFDATVRRIEIVLADGEIVTASADERPDLFNAAAGTFGSFGVITSLEIQLIPAQPYVRVTYTPVTGMDMAVTTFEATAQNEATDYLDGIMFTLDRGLVISGVLTDRLEEGSRERHFRGPWDPWFYQHAEAICKKDAGAVNEIVPIREYLFRYDRGAFWAGKYAFRYFLTPMNILTRWALDNFMHTTVMYHALHKSRISDQFIVQDIGFPYATVTDFINYIDSTLGFYPLWLCPLRMAKDTSLRPREMRAFATDARSPGMMMNVGLWGPAAQQYERWVQINRDIERKTAELGGLKCFYAQGFYTPDEFWDVYDRSWYDRLRAKYNAEGLRSVYDRVNLDLSARRPREDMSWSQRWYENFIEQWPVRGVYGVVQLFREREYLLA